MQILCAGLLSMHNSEMNDIKGDLDTMFNTRIFVS